MSATAVGSFSARLGGEERREAASQPREAERREHRGRIRRADDCAEQERLRPREVEEQFAATPVDGHRHDDADRAEQERRAERPADVAPLGRQPALEENRDQPDDADRTGELRVVEVDAADALRAEQHAEAEERDEQRKASRRVATAEATATRRTPPAIRICSSMRVTARVCQPAGGRQRGGRGVVRRAADVLRQAPLERERGAGADEVDARLQRARARAARAGA